MSNLLINNFHRFPHLKNEWDYEKNTVDINTITYGSSQKIHWKCDKGHLYTAKLDTRTYKKGSNCKQCLIDSKRIHSKDKVEEKRNSDKFRINTTKVGDDTEDYVVDLLRKTNKFKNVEKIGNTGSNADIRITHFDNTINYIQVKTLIKGTKREDHYFIHNINNKKYDDNLLIVMVDKKRLYFALDFVSNIKSGLSLYFNSVKSKYKDIMFNDEEKFVNRLIELIPKSTKNENNSNDNIKEIESLERFKDFCENNGIEYSRNTTNGNSVDGMINEYRFQAKFVSFNNGKSLTYSVNSYKSAGNLNGKIIHRPYEVDDFDFIVIEVAGTKEEPEKYKENFCIIPSKILEEQSVLKSDSCKGKTTFRVCPPDYDKPHWSKKFWNNIDNI